MKCSQPQLIAHGYLAQGLATGAAGETSGLSAVSSTFTAFVNEYQLQFPSAPGDTAASFLVTLSYSHGGIAGGKGMLVTATIGVGNILVEFWDSVTGAIYGATSSPCAVSFQIFRRLNN